MWLGPVPLQRCGSGLSPCEGVAWLGSAWPGSSRLVSAWRGLAFLGSARLGSAWLGLAFLVSGLPRSAEVGLLGTALAWLARLVGAWLASDWLGSTLLRVEAPLFLDVRSFQKNIRFLKPIMPAEHCVCKWGGGGLRPPQTPPLVLRLPPILSCTVFF